MLMISTVVNVVIFAQAYYLRAHKQEVFFVNSVVGAVSVTACTFVFGWYYGALAVVLETSWDCSGRRRSFRSTEDSGIELRPAPSRMQVIQGVGIDRITRLTGRVASRIDGL